MFLFSIYTCCFGDDKVSTYDKVSTCNKILTKCIYMYMYTWNLPIFVRVKFFNNVYICKSIYTLGVKQILQYSDICSLFWYSNRFFGI